MKKTDFLPDFCTDLGRTSHELTESVKMFKNFDRFSPEIEWKSWRYFAITHWLNIYVDIFSTRQV